MAKIRILHIVQSAGGVDRYIQMLLKYLDKDKYENIIICSQDFKRKDYYQLVSVFEQIEMHREICISDLKVVLEIRKLIKKYDPDIIYNHSSKAGALGRIANMGLGNYSIYNPHGWAFNMRCSKKKQYVYKLIEKIAAPFCNKIVCISEAEKQSALKMKICKEEKINVIYNGIDFDEYNSSSHKIVEKKEIGIPQNAFVLGMVGRISQQKAPDIFIRVAKKIKEKIPSAHFIIVGSGEMENEIKQYAQKYGFLESLHITGWVNNPLSYVKLFDIACLLSRWEGFGLAIPEYMMCHKPIVASNIDAIPNLIQDNRNGMLVPVDDVDAAYKAIMKIYDDAELKKNLIECGEQEVHNKYDARRVAIQHESMFDKVKKMKNGE